MASLQDYQQNLSARSKSVSNLLRLTTSLLTEVQNGATRGTIESRYLYATRTANGLTERINNLFDQLQADNQVSADEKRSLKPTFDALEVQLGDIQGQLARIPVLADQNFRARTQQQEQRAQQAQESTPKDSAGETAEQEKRGQAEGAQTQAPEPVAATTGSTGTNSTVPATSNDSQLGNQTGSNEVGGSVPTKKTSSTQSGQSAVSDDQIGASTDANGTSVGTGTDGQVPVSEQFLKKIEDNENVLQKFSNMAYSISWYFVPPDAAKAQFRNPRKTITTERLLVQSGGIAVGDRDPRFDVDFYIEDLEFKTIVGTQGMGGPGQTANLSFNVVEPYGISLLERLRKVIEDEFGGADKSRNIGVQNYLLVIRFYGYDDNGNLISAAESGAAEAQSDPNAVVEKWIPFLIRKITYKITDSVTTYNLDAVGTATAVNYGQKRAAIPFNLQLSAANISELFNGTAQYQQPQEDEPPELGNSAYISNAIQEFNQPPKAGALKSNNPQTVVKGLASALNDYENRLVAENKVEFANQYVIEIENVPGLIDAKLAKPGRPDKLLAVNNEAQTAAQRYLENKGFYDKDSRTYNIKAGTMIETVIDLVMRTSSYVTGQQNVVYDEKTGKVSGKAPDVQTVQWYKVRTTAVPIGDRVDNKRGDYAYLIRYTISRYQINTPNVASFPAARYRGVHKKYNWIFTGQNTEVLDFEIDVNSNYFVVVGLGGQTYQNSNGRFPLQQHFQSAPNASLQGGLNNSTIPAASLAARLYDIADVASAKLKIVGDPDWIQQDNIFYNNIDLAPFNPDRSINYSASEALFSITFNRVTDYNLENGLMEVNNFNETYADGNSSFNEPTETIVWGAHTVISSFKKGMFSQEVMGTVRDFRSSVFNRISDLSEGGFEPELGFDTDFSQTNAELDADAADTGWITGEPPVNEYDLADPGRDYGNGGGFRPRVAEPTVQRRLSNGKTVNFNVQQAVDQGLPYRDVDVNGQLTRVYGNERDLLQYYGSQGVAPKPGSGENAVPEDGGDTVKANSQTVYTNGWG